MNAGPVILTVVMCILPLLMLGLGFALGHRVGKFGWSSFRPEKNESNKKNGSRILRSNG
jgi:hypothetical protein